MKRDTIVNSIVADSGSPNRDDGGTLGKSLDYWKSRLDGIAPIELPHDRQRPARLDNRGGTVEFELSSATLGKLEALAQSAGVTPYMTLLAAFDVLLMRYSGQSDVSVGTPIEGGTHPGLTGYFFDMLVMRTDLSGDPGFDELLARVRETCLGAYEHQDVPFEMLVQHLAPERALDRNPLVQVSFALQNAPRPTVEIGAAPARLESIHTDTARFDLSLTMTAHDGGMKANLEYSADLFDHATVERMAGHFGNLIEGIVGNPREKLSALPLMSPQELHRMLVQWNDTARDYPLDRTLHEIFEEQAARNPGACAVVFEDRQLDYAGLDAHANRLAHHLRTRGVGPDVLVGVCMPRCPELVVAILAVLKAGGAFLPIDPDYPEERIAFVLEDSAAPVVLTIESALERLPAAQHQHAIALDSPHWLDLTRNLPAHRPAPLAGPDDLAYVIYTSGSTGRPKGAAVPHRGFCNHVLWIIECIGLNAADRLLQKTTISFDASLWEFLAPLAIGAPVILARPGGERDMQYLVEVIREQRITILQMVPSALRVLLGERSISACESLRYVNCGGEALDWELAGEFARCLPAVRLGNFYGPSEASDNVTHVDVTDLSPGSGQVPIGRPIANTRAYVLDTHRQPVPIGVAGELYIGGTGVGRGYLNRPELTAERFVDDPFVPGARLYRTGDLVHWRPDGLIGFIGRTDHQVKHRGFRIELGEIESVLNTCDGVRNSAVVVREDQRGTRRLVAYVEGEGLEATALRADLKSRLPDYMVPEIVVPLPRLPLLPNDKLDRKALPVPEASAAGPDFVAPRSPIEQTLADIWANVLGCTRVGVHDNFFDLGGHSLNANQAMARLRSAMDVALPLRALFEAPTVAELAACVHAERGDTPTGRQPPLAARDHAIVEAPLSYSQEALWFLDRLAGPHGAYNIAMSARLVGAIRPEALERALQALVERHDALRTAFDDRDGEPLQHVVHDATITLPLESLEVIVDDAREGELARRMREQALAAFDLSRAPLMRAHLYRLAPDDHALLIVVHHIVSDGWSCGLMAQELGTLYRAFERGEQPALPALPLRFGDFAAWQRACGEAPMQHSLARWRERLAGLEPLELPTDFPRPPQPSGSGDTVDFTIAPERGRALRRLAREYNATLYMVLLAAFQTLLMRHSGQTDFAVGTSVAGRSHPELEGLFGFFVNALVMRTDLSGDPAFADLLERVRERSLDDYAHEVPFDVLVRHLNPERLLDRNPVYQVAFVLQNLPDYDLAIGQAPAWLEDVDNGTAKFDLALEVIESDDSLLAHLTYSTDLFERATIERMAAHLCNLIDAIVEDPHTRLSALPLMGSDERDRLLVRFNDTARPYPLHKTLHQLFEEQAALTPEATAVVFEHTRLDYASLDAQANRLAHHLRSLGVRPDVLVGVCMHRCPELVVAMLAVLKAGGAYVPIDPEYPSERIAFMLEDCGAAVVLTERTVRDRLADTAPTARVLALDSPDTQGLLSTAPADPPGPLAGPDDLAYVIYTSGSTGRPKGAMIPHRGVTNHVFWLIERLDLSAADRLLQKTTISFDASVWEFFAPLAVGAPVVLARPGGEKDTEYLAHAIREQDITILQMVPSALRVLLQEPSIDTCMSLRYVVSGGEALDWELAGEFERRLPRARLGNMYGPSEASDDTTSVDVADVPPGPGAVPIGRPIANARVYVLDAHRQPVPLGVAGELYIGGAGLARGYLNRPELTAERFVDDPFVTGQRLYRTGDLVRWRPDGLIGFIGRTDHQVKIRGFRIELGEIENALKACTGVRNGVVVVHEDRPGNRRLVAYVEGRQLDPARLRAELGERLPDYMVPAFLVMLPELPLLPNGKLDRKALPAPEAGFSHGGSIAARSPLEQTLADIWADVLGCARVGVHDNFFDLGGHSLSATQAMARLRSVMGVALPLRTLFEAPTVAELAARVQTALGESSHQQLVPLVPGAGSRSDRVPASSAQQALWTIERLNGPSGLYNIPLAIRLVGELDTHALAQALQAFVDRHPALRTRFDQGDEAPVQIIAPHVEVRLPIADMSTHANRPPTAPAEDADAIAHDEALDPALDTAIDQLAEAPFDLARGPLLRAQLLRVSATDHVFVFVVHHIVADGWSIGLLARELPLLYRHARAGEQAALPPPAQLDFRDYAVWQQQWLASDAARTSLGWWRERLAGLEPLELPTDFPRPHDVLLRGDAVELVVSAERLAGLKTLARASRATLHMVLLAAFEALLMRYSGQHDFAVGTPVAGREHAELEGVFGMFVNMLVMRADLSGDPDFASLVQRVRQGALAAYSHQGIPFDRIVAEINPVREANRNPLFQVSFSVNNTPPAPFELPGIKVRKVAGHGESAKFDLSLSFAETGTELHGTLEYSADLFERATIERMASHLHNLIDAVIENPHARLSALPLMGRDELDQLLVQFNDTARSYPQHLTLHQLFEQQAARAPEAIAVAFEHHRLTYAELDARANRLAHHLRSLGVQPDSLVGICMPRCIELVVAMLAVLKAGGAYLPIDPDYPTERIAFMLDEGAATVVLTTSAALSNLPTAQRDRAIVLDGAHWLEVAGALPDRAPEPTAGPEHLAYVIYTSGSTGRPKGVMVPHRAVTRLVCNTDYVRIGPGDCIAHASNPSFDAATFEIWGALLNGARVAIVSNDVLLSAPDLRRWIAEDRIDTMFVTTALFNEHVANAPDTFSGLRDLLTGGEAASPQAIARVLRHGPPRRLLNVYGPTETTTFATWFELPREPDDVALQQAIPIGRPIANTSCHVLDESMQPVPAGVVGELWIGGPGLARGYLNRPQLTAERFVEDPFSPGERLYRTGDRVSRRADGAIVFCGRADEQVKIRGFRIELAEIRSALATLRGLRQQEVIVREDAPGDRRLTAYLVWEPGLEPLHPDAIRTALAPLLPSFMMPAAFVALEALPITPNGKLDRAALPAPPTAAHCERGNERDVPEAGDETERELRAIWESVLGHSGISLDDNFFDLGGHSMLAVRLLAEVERRTGTRLRTAAFFRAPTIRRFAALLRDETAAGAHGCVVTIQKGDGRHPLFFVSGWGGQLIVLNELAKHLRPTQPFHVLDVGAFEAGEAALTIEKVAATMIEDMRRVQPRGPYRLAGYSMGGAIVYEIAQQLRQRGEDVALLVLLDCAAPGYPRRHSAPMRVLLHLRKAATMKPAQMLAYVAGRARWMIRNPRERERSLFEGSNIEETTFTRMLEQSAGAMLAAWNAYEYLPYPGRVMLVRAEATPKSVGDIDDDLTHGWASLTGGVDLRSMQCTHNRMLFSPHAADLARILGQTIPPDDGGNYGRNGAPHSQPATRREFAKADA